MAPNSASEPDLDIPDSPLPTRAMVADSARDAGAAPKPGSLTGTEKRVAAASIVGGGLVTLLILMSRTGVSAVPPPRPVAARPCPRVPPQFVGGGHGGESDMDRRERDTWVTRSRGAFAYEVLADKPVASGCARCARPVVRCEGNVSTSLCSRTPPRRSSRHARSHRHHATR